MSMKEEYSNIDEWRVQHHCSGGFTVPDQYFALASQEILKKTADAAIGKTGSFRTPNDYFEVSQQQIMQKIRDKKTKRITLYTRWSIGIAAAFIAVSTVILVTKQPSHQSSFSAALAQVSDEEIVNYAGADAMMDNQLFEMAVYAEPKSQQIEEYIMNQSNEDLLIEDL